VGGLVGRYFEGNLLSSYATGSVKGRDRIEGWVGVGGLVGCGAPHVVDCFATGSVTGGSSIDGLGGLIGVLEVNGGPISRCYSSGRVSGGGWNIGGLIGQKTSPSSRVELCAWDVETSGQSASDGGVGLTTKEMKDRATYGDLWDFAHTWDMISGLSYPFLQGDNPYFTRYGHGCGGSLGYVPSLNVRGGPNPFEISIQVSRGVPSGFGALFVSPTRVDGACLLFGSPYFGPFSLSLDDNGEADVLSSVMGLTSGDRFVLQFLGVEGATPDLWDTSNGMQILLP